MSGTGIRILKSLMALSLTGNVGVRTYAVGAAISRRRRMTSFSDPKVKAAFDAFPPRLRGPLLKLREVILKTAAETPDVGKLTETLKWGEPAYLPAKPNVGTTVRIGAVKGSNDRYAAFFHCQTTLLPTFREMYPDVFVFEGNRALIFTVGKSIAVGPFKHCVALALTYHRRK